LAVEVVRHADVRGFLACARDFLESREAEHNLILGLCAQLRRDPRLYGSDPYFASVVATGRIVAAALRTPPHNLVLSEVDDAGAIEPLVADASAAFDELPGALGPTGPVERFARSWEAATGARARLALAERIYRAEEVIRPDGVGGRMRPYATADRGRALEWLEAFAAEALSQPAFKAAADVLERRLAEPEGGIVFWEDGEPVSLAGYGGPTPNGIRVGPVYTPPDLRGRGYATALVGELTRTLLEGGRRFCFLFTDLANPTSNTIYQRVGYRPVTDVDQWAFEY
jgi:predicted GNAT family acetyltransferase